MLPIILKLHIFSPAPVNQACFAYDTFIFKSQFFFQMHTESCPMFPLNCINGCEQIIPRIQVNKCDCLFSFLSLKENSMSKQASDIRLTDLFLCDKFPSAPSCSLHPILSCINILNLPPPFSLSSLFTA